jgi:hypothetical protein
VRLDANIPEMVRAQGLNPWFAVHSLLTPRSRPQEKEGTDAGYLSKLKVSDAQTMG